MTVVSSVLMLAGGLVAILAGVGIVRLTTPYARFHAAGKGSPIAFVVAALGAALELGPGGAASLVIASLAMTLTLPLGVHLLFRAVHRTEPQHHPTIDELAPVERAGPRRDPGPRPHDDV